MRGGGGEGHGGHTAKQMHFCQRYISLEKWNSNRIRQAYIVSVAFRSLFRPLAQTIPYRKRGFYSIVREERRRWCCCAVITGCRASARKLAAQIGETHEYNNGPCRMSFFVRRRFCRQTSKLRHTTLNKYSSVRRLSLPACVRENAEYVLSGRFQVHNM